MADTRPTLSPSATPSVDKLVEALTRIAGGTPDDQPPFRSMPASEMQRIARTTLGDNEQ